MSDRLVPVRDCHTDANARENAKLRLETAQISTL
jgi:hypothetical protein